MLLIISSPFITASSEDSWFEGFIEWFKSLFKNSDPNNINQTIILKNSSMTYKNFKLTFIQVSDSSKSKFISYLNK